MTRRLRFAALAAVAALAFAGCANNDAKKSDVVNAMKDSLSDSGLSEAEVDEAAECIGEGVDQEFSDDQDLYNEVAAAADTEDFPDYPEGTEGPGGAGNTGDVVNAILEDCLGPGTGGDE
ncbi:MAG TPA: hypothetical protein VFZ30_06545 [Acidimicrobiales bacterium]|jgi:hypothetical protein